MNLLQRESYILTSSCHWTRTRKSRKREEERRCLIRPKVCIDALTKAFALVRVCVAVASFGSFSVFPLL